MVDGHRFALQARRRPGPALADDLGQTPPPLAGGGNMVLSSGCRILMMKARTMAAISRYFDHIPARGETFSGILPDGRLSALSHRREGGVG